MHQQQKYSQNGIIKLIQRCSQQQQSYKIHKMLSKFLMRQSRSLKSMTSQIISAWKSKQLTNSYLTVDRRNLIAQLNFSNKSYFSTSNNLQKDGKTQKDTFKDVIQSLSPLDNYKSRLSHIDNKNIFQQINKIQPNLSRSNTLKLLYKLSILNFKGQLFDRLWLSLVNNLDKLSINHLIAITFLGSKNMIWKDRGEIQPIVKKIYNLIKNKERIILNIGTSQQLENDQLDLDSSEIFLKVKEKYFSYYIHLLFKHKFMNQEQIAQLIGYVFVDEKNASNLTQSSSILFSRLTRYLVNQDFKISLLHKKFIDRIISQESLKTNDSYDLLDLLKFVSNTIRFQQQQQYFSAKVLDSALSNKLDLQIKQKKQYLLAVVTKLLKKCLCYVQMLNQSKNRMKPNQISKLNQKFFADNQNKSALVIASKLIFYLSINNLYIVKQWMQILTMVLNLKFNQNQANPIDKNLIDSLIQFFKYLNRLKKQVVPSNIYQNIIQKQKIAFSKKLAKIYLGLQPQLQKYFFSELNIHTFQKYIKPHLSQNQVQTKIFEEDNHQQYQEQTKSQQKSQQININHQITNRRKSKLEKLFNQQLYIRILKIDFDLMKKQLQIYRSIKRKILQLRTNNPEIFKDFYSQEVQSIISTCQNTIQYNPSLQISKNQDSKSQVKENLTQKTPETKITKQNQKIAQKQQQKVIRNREKQVKQKQPNTKGHIKSQIHDQSLKIQESQLDIQMMNQEWQISQIQNRQNIQLPAGLSKFEFERKQKWLGQFSQKRNNSKQKKMGLFSSK